MIHLILILPFILFFCLLAYSYYSLAQLLKQTTEINPELLSRAKEVFGDAQKAQEWFYLPCQALGGLAPRFVPAEQVQEVLGRIEFGVIS